MSYVVGYGWPALIFSSSNLNLRQKPILCFSKRAFSDRKNNCRGTNVAVNKIAAQLHVRSDIKNCQISASGYSPTSKNVGVPRLIIDLTIITRVLGINTRTWKLTKRQRTIFLITKKCKYLFCNCHNRSRITTGEKFKASTVIIKHYVFASCRAFSIQ